MNNSVSSNGWVWLVARLVLLFCFPRSAKVDCQNSWRWQLCHHTPVLPVANSAAVHPARCCAKAHLGESQRLASPFLGEGCTIKTFCWATLQQCHICTFSNYSHPLCPAGFPGRSCCAPSWHRTRQHAFARHSTKLYIMSFIQETNVRMLWDTARTWSQCFCSWNFVGEVVQAL